LEIPRNEAAGSLEAWLGLQYGYLEQGKEVTLPVLSGSMFPSLVPGREIMIQPASWRNCQIGDIIVYKQDKKLTAHRLLFRFCSFKKKGLFQKGDANNHGSWINANRVVGKVIKFQNTDGLFVDMRTQNFARNMKFSARMQLIMTLFRYPFNVLRKIKRKLQRIVGNKTSDK
jgi:signal peptidase I